ncbi:hypothetical protein IV500_14950 [Paeniglutamicibacter antarcticus]|uniref:Uncharacterized protein n=1 Tax=Arthrobacter terrae TaxID=2935737 RepID=A0A931CR77_9MICC|nr:hypothetical protein [Arthrobacter terrae]MBG0740676.1 hypothetical protein [Arthrobacter terrae]
MTKPYKTRALGISATNLQVPGRTGSLAGTREIADLKESIAAALMDSELARGV